MSRASWPGRLGRTFARSSSPSRLGSAARTSPLPSPGRSALSSLRATDGLRTTLPKTLITILGIEKLLPTLDDLEVFLQLLPRSSTGERMNPYTSLWTGVAPCHGPQEFHVVLLDNGRTNVLADEIGRQTLSLIRCSACLNVCPCLTSGPVATRTGSVYPGPIGAILTPQLVGTAEAGSLPFASSLCGACAEVCPVKIDIPQVLVHLRGRAVRERRVGVGERTAMAAAARTLRSPWRFGWARRVGRLVQRPFVSDGRIERLPGGCLLHVNARPPAMLAGHSAAGGRVDDDT